MVPAAHQPVLDRADVEPEELVLVPSAGGPVRVFAGDAEPGDVILRADDFPRLWPTAVA